MVGKIRIFILLYHDVFIKSSFDEKFNEFFNVPRGTLNSKMKMEVESLKTLR